MGLDYYLTPSEQIIMKRLSGAKAIDKAQIKDLLHDMNGSTIDNSLKSLVKKGALIRIKRGLYIPNEKGGMDLNDLLRISTMVYGGYVAFSTALKIHGLLDYEPFRIFVSTPKRSVSKYIGEFELRFVAMGNRCRGQTNINGVWVSDLEKTFFDCFFRPDLAGGYQNISKALILVQNIDWMRFSTYLDGFGTTPMKQRVGYIVSRTLIERTTEEVEEFLNRLREYVSVPTRLVPSGPLTGKMDSTWKVQDNLGKNVWMEWKQDVG